MANEIYDSTWWGNTIDTASSIGTSTEMIQGQINMNKLGDDLVVNGDFATDSDWVKGTNWIISNGLATYNPTGFSNLSQTTIGLEVGKTYKLKVNLIGGSGNVCRFYFGGSSSTAYNLVNGENTIIGIAVSDKITFRNLQQSQFSIDNVSVQQIRATTVEAKKCLADAIHRIGLQDIQN